MKRKFLEDLGLDKETIEKIIDQNSQDIGGYKKKVEELQETNTQLKKDVETRDTQLEELGKAGSVDDLKQQLQVAQEANEAAKAEYEETIKNMKLDAAIEKALTGVKHADLLSVKFDREKLKLNDDGQVEGLEAQVKSLKETYKDLFKPEKSGRGLPNPEGGTVTITKEQFDKMKYSERLQLFNENKELYDQLAGGNENG